MSFDPGAIISLIENCMKVYNYAADVKHSSKERRQLLDEVQSLQSQLEALKKLTETPGISGDKASMGQLAKVLDSSEPFVKVVDETLGRVEDVLTYGTSDPKATRFKVLGKRGAAALWWTVDKAEVKDLFSDLERYKTQIGLALEHDIFKKQNVMDGKLDVVDGKQDVVVKHLNTEDRLKIAKFISENDFVGHQKDLIEARLPETGTWVLRHPNFVTWRDNSDSERSVWCHGLPGVGKSVIAALIVDHLRSTPGTIVLSVFCRYDKVTTLTTPFPVLRGLLRQLIEKSLNVPPALYDLYKSQTEPEPNALPGFLNDLAASHAQPIYIIIDALDECPIRIDLLRAVQDLASSFRILVTSRPVFGEIHEHTTIEIRAADEDILTAVNTTLQKLKHAWLDEKLKHTIRWEIIKKANGMFLLASLQLRELERDVTRPHDVTAILESLPRTLDAAYKLTFQRIREQGERKIELTCRAFALVALHSAKWDSDDLQCLLAGGDQTQYTDIESILQCCHGLVYRTSADNSNKYEFIHYSVHEYITAHWSELFPENPNRSNICLGLGYSALICPVQAQSRWNNYCWEMIVASMREREELEQVTSLLSTPAARAALVEYSPELAPLVHDPLLIACHQWYWNVMEYMIRSAPPDVQRFNEALRVCQDGNWFSVVDNCTEYINARPDMRVKRSGVVVAVSPDGGEGTSSDAEDDDSD